MFSSIFWFLLLSSSTIEIKSTKLTCNCVKDCKIIEINQFRDNKFEYSDSHICRRNVTDIQIENSIFLEIPSQLFIKHQNIQYFNIIENIGLRSIGVQSMFRHSKKLIGFRVMRNNITVIKNRTFFGATFLHSLYLNDNHIVYLEPKAFDGLDNLYMLFLESNNIKSLATNLFQSLKQINHILLNQNKIRKIKN